VQWHVLSCDDRKTYSAPPSRERRSEFDTTINKKKFPFLVHGKQITALKRKKTSSKNKRTQGREKVVSAGPVFSFFTMKKRFTRALK
jgi:hypothetical protein